MASSSKARVVTFGLDDVMMTGVNDEGSDADDFYEITTSEAESFSTSDEDDAEFIQMALENAFSCSPLKRQEPAQMSSYLLLDKDLIDSDDDQICTFLSIL